MRRELRRGAGCRALSLPWKHIVFAGALEAFEQDSDLTVTYVFNGTFWLL